MANTFIKIATVTVGAGGASSIDFTSIPSTYTDLVVKLSSRSTTITTATGVVVQFNGSSTGYSYKLLESNGASAASYSGTTARAGVTGGNTNVFGNFEMYIPNYAGNTNKSISTDSVQENNEQTTYADLNAGLWSNTAAISSISMTLQAGNFAQYSTATLYGISKS